MIITAKDAQVGMWYTLLSGGYSSMPGYSNTNIILVRKSEPSMESCYICSKENVYKPINIHITDLYLRRDSELQPAQLPRDIDMSKVPLIRASNSTEETENTITKDNSNGCSCLHPTINTIPLGIGGNCLVIQVCSQCKKEVLG